MGLYTIMCCFNVCCLTTVTVLSLTCPAPLSIIAGVHLVSSTAVRRQLGFHGTENAGICSKLVHATIPHLLSFKKIQTVAYSTRPFHRSMISFWSYLLRSGRFVSAQDLCEDSPLSQYRRAKALDSEPLPFFTFLHLDFSLYMD
jgi:hypothetical protein